MAKSAPETKAAGATTQVYTRLKKKDAIRLRKAAERDERSVMTYLRRLIESHLDEIDSKKGQ